jgi:exosortase
LRPSLPVVALATLAALLLACAPWIVSWGLALWARPHYQFFPVVVIGAIVLALGRWPGLGQLQAGALRPTVVFLALGWLALAVAEAAYSPWLGAAGVLFVLAGLLYGVGGWTLLRAMLPAWGFLWLVVPLPFGVDKSLIMNLQSLTTQWTSGLLDLMKIDHLMAGNVVEISGRRLFVEEACSGINSLFAVLACTVFFVLWARRPIAHAILLVAASIGWVIVVNTGRAAFLAVANEKWGLYLFEGWRHEVVGFAAFFLTLLLVWSTDSLFRFFYSSTFPKPAAPRQAVQPTRLPALGTTWLAALPALAAFALLGVVQLGFIGLDAPQQAVSSPEFEKRLLTLDANALPERWNNWTRREFTTATRDLDSEFGAHSRVWYWKASNGDAALSCDFLFPEWHDLTICYLSQGWKVNEQTHLSVDGLPVSFERLEKPGSRYGMLFFAEFDAQGNPVYPPRAGFFYRLERRLGLFGQRWLGIQPNPETVAGTLNAGPVAQVQLLIESYAPLSPVETDQALSFFMESVAQLRKAGLAPAS